MFIIKAGDRVIKKYPFRAQCVAWLFLHGWAWQGREDWAPYAKMTFFVNPGDLSEKVCIIEEKNG